MLKGQKYRGVERPSGRKVLKGSIRVQCQKTENVLEFSGRGRILLTRGWGRGGAKQVNLLLLWLQTVNVALQWKPTCAESVEWCELKVSKCTIDSE